MIDMRKQAEKLRTEAAECALIRDLATDPVKRELFSRLAEHLNVLASEVERAIAEKMGTAGHRPSPRAS
jgi:heme oxygenase